MPSVTLHASLPDSPSRSQNPLPNLLQTPSGLAILEIQGTLHVPSASTECSDNAPNVDTTALDVGRLEFPLYDASAPADISWMKRVYFYVGKHQRLTGEVKKLPKPIAIIRKRALQSDDPDAAQSMDVDVSNDAEERPEELEIMDIVKYKILFASRPDPVGSQIV